MRIAKILGLATCAAATLVVVAPAQAQEADDAEGWWRWAVAEVLAGEEIRTTRGERIVIDRRGRDDPDDRYDRDDRDDDYYDRRDREDEGIPAFCRTGEGHPVFGRDWCIDKGFGLGRNTWRRGDLGNVIFRGDRRYDDRILDRPGLEEILGGIILGRLLARSDADDAGRLTGRWLELEDRGARVLQVRAGNQPLAELTDLDGDGRVDVSLWNAPEGDDADADRGAGPPRGRP